MRPLNDSYAGNDAVILAGGGLTAVVLPALGAKIISLVSDRTGREFIWRDPHRVLRPITPGSAYVENDVSGVDDCFPTIDPCVYPAEPFRGLELGDHGDLWSRQWDWSLSDDSASFSVTGATLPFRFQKWITIESSPSRLLVRNALHAVGEQAFEYQWTGHPCFVPRKGHGSDYLRVARPALASPPVPGWLSTDRSGPGLRRPPQMAARTMSALWARHTWE